jgi:hypothetical protein
MCSKIVCVEFAQQSIRNPKQKPGIFVGGQKMTFDHAKYIITTVLLPLP